MRQGVIGLLGLAWSYLAACSSQAQDAGAAAGTDAERDPKSMAGETAEVATAAVETPDDADASGDDMPNDSYDPGPVSPDSTRCGDGLRGADEACDDGNEVNADGCNRDCQRSGMRVMTFARSGGVLASDLGFAIAATPDGGAVVAGTLSREGGTRAQWIGRVERDGALTWEHVTGNAGDDRLRGVVVDSDGVAFAVGKANLGANGEDPWVGRFEADGTPGWSGAREAIATTGADTMTSVALAPDQTLLAVAHVQFDAAVVRINPTDGAHLDTVSLATPAWDRAWGIAVGGDGTFVVAGQTDGVDDAPADAWMAAYDAGGTQLWTHRFDGEAGLLDSFSAVTVLDDGHVGVCGRQTLDTESAYVMDVRRFDVDGSVVWERRYSGAASAGAYCTDLAHDSDGNIVVVGAERSGGSDEILVRKYDPDGAELWTVVTPGSVANEVARAVSIGPNDEIWVAGDLDIGVDGADIWAARFTP